MLRSLLLRLSRIPTGNRRGGVLVFVALGMLTSLVMAGLAIDLGGGYILKTHLSRAADAAALAAARALRDGQDAATSRALAVAGANGVVDGANATTIGLSFGTNELDEQTVTVTASRAEPTLLMRLIGRDSLQVRSGAVAAVPPVDLVLVLDQSGSLDQADAWDDLQDAAKQFVRQFDDGIDQMGLVSFNLRAETHFLLQQPFTSQSEYVIDTTNALGYTNTGEGLRHAFQQFQSGLERTRSAKVVVFFTDGRPTAFRGNIAGRDRVMAAYSSPYYVMGLWNDPDDLPIHYRPTPDYCNVVTSCAGYRRDDVFDSARDTGYFWANQIRSQDILIYTIGLGDTSQPPGSILQPDQTYLRQLANEDGITDPNQPKGKMYFAPSAAEIRTVFNLVAQDLLARLAH